MDKTTGWQASFLDGAGHAPSHWLDVTHVETAWVYFHGGEDDQPQ